MPVKRLSKKLKRSRLSSRRRGPLVEPPRAASEFRLPGPLLNEFRTTRDAVLCSLTRFPLDPSDR